MKVLAVTFFGTVVLCLGASASEQETGTRSGQRMHEIYLEDQADREPPGGDLSKLDWAKIGPRDGARRAEVRRMIEAGKLTTGVELREASFVFQHGSEPN